MALIRRGLAGKLRLVPACYSTQRWFKNSSDSQAGTFFINWTIGAYYKLIIRSTKHRIELSLG